MHNVVGIQRREYEENGVLSSRTFDHPSSSNRVVITLDDENLEVSFQEIDHPRQVGLKMPWETAVAMANLILAVTEGDMKSVTADL